MSLEGLPKTRLLYLRDAYVREFEAKILRVVKVNGRRGLVLDSTAFYPMGGGQPADTGLIRGPSGEAAVSDAQARRGVVVHFTEEVAGELREGEVIEGIIDWKRRYTLMKNHTTAHLMSEAIRRALGAPVAVVGSAIELDKARLDLAYNKSIRPFLPEIERIANQVVEENRPVIVRFIPRKEAESYVARFHESLKMLPPNVQTVRIVEVENWHACACGGTHVKATGEIRGVKLLRRSSKGRGVERVEFVALQKP